MSKHQITRVGKGVEVKLHYTYSMVSRLLDVSD
jgi:hypothetical protein